MRLGDEQSGLSYDSATAVLYAHAVVYIELLKERWDSWVVWNDCVGHPPDWDDPFTTARQVFRWAGLEYPEGLPAEQAFIHISAVRLAYERYDWW